MIKKYYYVGNKPKIEGLEVFIASSHINFYGKPHLPYRLRHLENDFMFEHGSIYNIAVSSTHIALQSRRLKEEEFSLDLFKDSLVKLYEFAVRNKDTVIVLDYLDIPKKLFVESMRLIDDLEFPDNVIKYQKNNLSVNPFERKPEARYCLNSSYALHKGSVDPKFIIRTPVVYYNSKIDKFALSSKPIKVAYPIKRKGLVFIDMQVAYDYLVRKNKAVNRSKLLVELFKLKFIQHPELLEGLTEDYVRRLKFDYKQEMLLAIK